MNKKEFIKELTKKLQVLEENEIKDIVDEYSGIIDEKVKHGKTEEEAVKDFGDISELAEEILSAYKINPNYKNDSVKNIVNDCEVLIKKGASKLTDFSKRVAEDLQKDDSKFNIETLFEILIKVFIMLLIFALIRIPFEILFGLGSGLLGIAFYPLDVVLISIWRVIVIVANLLCCILIFIMMFKKYFNSSDKSETVVRKSTTKKTVKKNEKIKEEYKEDKNNNYEGSITRVVMTIIKLCIIICFIIPLVFTNIGIYVALSVVIFAVIKGVEVVGLAILLAGIAIIVSYILGIIYDSVFNHKKIYSYPFIIGTILIVVGGLVFFEEALNFDYINNAPETKFTKKTLTYEEKINKDTEINVNFGSKNYIEDNDLEDNKIIIEVTYYKDLIDTEKVNYNDGREIVIDIDHKHYGYKYKMNKEMYKLVINNLKDKEIYNYSKLFETDVTIYANSKTMDLIK